MKRLGLIIVSCIFSLLSVHTLYAQEQDKLLQLLKQELAADMQELQKQVQTAYKQFEETAMKLRQVR